MTCASLEIFSAALTETVTLNVTVDPVLIPSQRLVLVDCPLLEQDDE